MKTIILSFAFVLMTIVTSGQNCTPYFSYQDSSVFTYFYGYADSLNYPMDSVNSWSWTFQGGGASYTSTLQNPIMQLSSNTTYTVCLSITTYSGCSGTYCDSIVNGLPCPTAGQDFSNCGLEATLNATVNPGDYNTHWIVPSGITAIDINSPTTSIIASSIGTYYLIWQVTNINGSICTDTISIEFITAPTSYAGGNYWPGLFGPNSNIKTDTVCGLAYNLNALPSIGNGMWITPDSANTWFESTGTSSPSPIPNDTVNINYYTVFNQTYYREFIWTENNNSCTDMDTLRVYFAPVPSGQFTIQQSDCFQNIYELVAHTWPLPNNIDYNVTYFDWNYFNGILDSSIISPTTSDTILVSWLTGNLYIVNLTTTNAWGCSSPLISHQINVPPIADISVTINNPTTIGSNDGYIDISISGGTPPFTYLWNTGQTTSSIYNLTSGLYLLNITDAYGCNNSLVFHLYEPYDTLGGPIVDTLITGIIDTCLNFVPDSFYISQINIINNTEVVVTWVFEYQGMMQTLDITYTFGPNGNYLVMLTINCGSKALTTYSSYIHINATGISEIINFNEIKLFPNPASDMFTIIATPPYNYSITTMSGKKVNGSYSTSEMTMINAANIPAGIYIIRIENNGNNSVTKLIIYK